MSWQCSQFKEIAGLVESRAGILRKPVLGRQETLIERAFEEEGFSNPQTFLEAIQTENDLLDRLVEVLTIGETFFFRHLEQFECIRREILPELLQRCGRKHVIRTWSAGCATGEEPYSLAILFQEEGLGRKSRIVGTDISRQALESARKGTYRNWSLRGTGAALVKPYLEGQDNNYVLQSAIRKMVDFRYLNLVQDLYPSSQTGICEMDLIVCRNVLIYFGKETVKAIARRLFDTLAPRGYLIAGASDPFLAGLAPFEQMQVGEVSIYRKPIQNVNGVTGARSRIDSQDEAAKIPLPSLGNGSAAPALSESNGNQHENNKEKLAAAQEALAKGDYELVAQLTESLLDDENAAVCHVRALANFDAPKAVAVNRQLVKQFPFSAELHYLCAMLLMQLEEDAEAEEMLRKHGYLDGKSPLTYFSLGALRQRQGDLAGAWTCYQKTIGVCGGLDPDAVIPYSDHETAGGLAAAAEAQLALLTEQETPVRDGGSPWTRTKALPHPASHS